MKELQRVRRIRNPPKLKSKTKIYMKKIKINVTKLSIFHISFRESLEKRP